MSMHAGDLFRAVRSNRSLSQRELAAVAGIPHSTVARVESGCNDPRVGTVIAVLSAVDLRLVVTDARLRLLPFSVNDDRDRADRLLPAHLPQHVIRDAYEDWWGWGRIAWHIDEPNVPIVSFRRRPRRRGSDADRVPDGLGLDKGVEPGDSRVG
jgi:transcriptional regulator with XRE-family HTH domain